MRSFLSFVYYKNDTLVILVVFVHIDQPFNKMLRLCCDDRIVHQGQCSLSSTTLPFLI